MVQHAVDDPVSAYFVHPWANQLYDSTERYIFARGGRWSTKSHEIAQWILWRIYNETINVLIARRFHSDIELSNLRLFKTLISERNLDRYFTVGANSIICKLTGSEIHLRGLDRYEQGIKSMVGLDLVWIEEAHDIKASGLNALRPTVRESGSQIVATWNPITDADPIEQMRQHVLANNPGNYLDIWTHWTMLHSTLQTPELHEEINATPEILRPHIWDGEFFPISAVNPFGEDRIREAATKIPPTEAHEEQIGGVDVAWTDHDRSDYTAAITIGHDGVVTRSRKWKETDTQRRLELVAETVSNCYMVLVDGTDAAGRGLAADLREQYNIPTFVVVFSNKVKSDLVYNLSRKLASDQLTLRGHDELVEELLRYGQDNSGKFGAMSGHDDMATALMLGAEGLRRQGL